MNGKTINRAIKIARALCPLHLETGIKCSHVAFLVKKNKIVKIGWNSAKTHPKSKKFPYKGKEGKPLDVHLHAELNVILKAKGADLSRHSLLAIRVDGENRLNNSKPCSGCRGVIDFFGLKNVYYSTANQTIEKL